MTPEASTSETLYGLLELENAKTFKYVQHPKKTEEAVTGAGTGGEGGGAAAGGEGVSLAMKVYLTKKERKRIRRTTRMERERLVLEALFSHFFHYIFIYEVCIFLGGDVCVESFGEGLFLCFGTFLQFGF